MSRIQSTLKSSCIYKICRIAIGRFTIINTFVLVLFLIGYFLHSSNSSQKSVLTISTHLSTQNPENLVYKITVWTSDFHISPIQDIKHQISSFGIRFIDKSLSGHCHLTKTCAQDLKVLNSNNGMSSDPEIHKQFYEAYKNDSEMNQVDIFMCFHPAATCELFMPFNRTMIVIASTRYELGRFSKEEWTRWNKNLQIIASDPRNVVAGNNLYDAEYIRYFTGIQAIVLPSLCAYTGASYKPISTKPFLIASLSLNKFGPTFMSMLSSSMVRLKRSVSIQHLRNYYKRHYAYSELAQHPAIVHIPYQVSVMSLFEQYRMNIPLFFPSLDLLTEWHYTYRVANERTWDGVSGKLRNASTISGVLGPEVPDPNNEFDREAIRYWLKYSDFYQWPHIILFNSTDDLIIKLKTTDLPRISENMKIYNANLTTHLREQWRAILQRTKQL